MPLTRLAALYVSAGFQPSDESVRKVQEAGEAVLSGWAGSRVPDLCRLALGLPCGDEAAEWFLEPFQEADRTFIGMQDVRKASLYAAGLAAEILAREDRDSVPLAFALLSASVANRIPSPASPGLAEDAQRHLTIVQKAWRARPRLVAPKVEDLDTASLVQVAESLAVNQFPQAGASMKEFATALAAHLKALSQQGQMMDRVAERLRLLDEEQVILWWFEGGASRDIGCAFSALPIGAAAVAAGHELADMRTHTAGPAGAPALLDMVISAGRKREKTTAVIEFVEICTAKLPVAWRKTRGAKARDKGVLDLCPLSAAMILSAEADDAVDWKASFVRSHPAASKARLSPLEIAVQAYREASYLSCS